MAPGKRGEQAILARPRQSLCETCRSISDLTALTNTQYVTFLTSEVLHAHRSDCSLQIAPQLQPSDASGSTVHCCMLHDVQSTMPHRALTSQIRHLHRPAGLKRWVEANKACPAGWRQVQPRQQDADTHRTLLDLQQLPHRERYHRMRCRPVNTAGAHCMSARVQLGWGSTAPIRELDSCISNQGGSRCHLRGAPQECSLQVQARAVYANTCSRWSIVLLGQTVDVCCMRWSVCRCS